MIQLYEHPLFVTSCYTTYLDTTDHSILIDKIYNIKENTTSNVRSNKGGYQSHAREAPDFDNDIVKNLFEKSIRPAALEIFNIWNLPVYKMERFCYWYNINNKYSYNDAHTHPDSHISGVYYVKVPNNSGNITMYRSESERDRMWHTSRDIIHQKIESNNPNINTQHWFDPKEGMLILFPSHLSHDVGQNLTDDVDEDRISLSFNFY